MNSQLHKLKLFTVMHTGLHFPVNGAKQSPLKSSKIESSKDFNLLSSDILNGPQSDITADDVTAFRQWYVAPADRYRSINFRPRNDLSGEALSFIK